LLRALGGKRAAPGSQYVSAALKSAPFASVVILGAVAASLAFEPLSVRAAPKRKSLRFVRAHPERFLVVPQSSRDSSE